MFAVAVKLAVLNAVVLSEIEDFSLTQKAKKLQEYYPDDRSLAFLAQLTCFRASMKTEVDKVIVNNATLSSASSYVVTALMLFLTLAVIVVSAERSFSKLKIIFLNY
jgi:hypothetical protein